MVKAFDAAVPRQKPVGAHVEPLIGHLHHEGGTEVDEVGIANIGEQGVGKPLRIDIPQMPKVGFPDKINEMAQPGRRRRTVVVLFKMVLMEEFYMLHNTSYGVKLRWACNPEGSFAMIRNREGRKVTGECKVSGHGAIFFLQKLVPR